MNEDYRRGLRQEHVEKIRRVLALLDQASRPEDLDLPGYRLHPLKGDLAGFWSVSIRANWRIVFRFEGQDVTGVDYLDYHEERKRPHNPLLRHWPQAPLCRAALITTGNKMLSILCPKYYNEVFVMTKNPPHPGLTVRYDCLEPLGLSVAEGAKALDVSRQALSNLVNGKAGISPEMAIRLSKAFGGTPEAWLRLQMAFDLAKARKHEHEIIVNRVVPPTSDAMPL